MYVLFDMVMLLFTVLRHLDAVYLIVKYFC